MFITVLALQINRALICRYKGLASQAHCIIANAIICLIAFVRVYYSVDVSVCMWVCEASPLSAECWHVAPSRWGTPSAPRCVVCSPSSDWSTFPVWSAGLACLPPSCSAPASAAQSAESQSHTIRNCFARLSAIAGGADVLVRADPWNAQTVPFIWKYHSGYSNISWSIHLDKKTEKIFYNIELSSSPYIISPHTGELQAYCLLHGYSKPNSQKVNNTRSQTELWAAILHSHSWQITDCFKEGNRERARKPQRKSNAPTQGGLCAEASYAPKIVICLTVPKMHKADSRERFL